MILAFVPTWFCYNLYLVTKDTNNPQKIHLKTKENVGECGTWKYRTLLLFKNGIKSYWIISYNAVWHKVLEDHTFVMVCYCCSWKREDLLVTSCNVWHRHYCNCQPCLAKDINNKLQNPGGRHSIPMSFCVNPHCILGVFPCHSFSHNFRV